MNYIPKPIDTSNITLSNELLELTELLATNTHDTWGLARMNSGWRYGPKRDDIKKETPCLVPYSELPESEKEFDRHTAIETLKVITLLGYKIEKCNE